MSLYDRAVTLGVKLDAAATADSSDAVLAQGQILVTELDLASSQLESVASMRATLSLETRPNLDVKAATQAIGAFRAGLSRHSAAAFQHAPAGTLRDLAKQQRATLERWVLATWRARVDELTPHAALATRDRLQGNATHRRHAETLLRKITTIRDLNPLVDAGKLQTELRADDLADWLEVIATLDKELDRALETLEAARTKHSPAVRAALARAGSIEGLRLDELTDELLSELRAAGVEEQLVVRHL
jgi:hypothetical protein